jgi:hypothetical protein
LQRRSYWRWRICRSAPKKLSANAVVNIISYYKKVEMSSATEFECHAGPGAHVFLKGDLAKIAGE